jgi:cytochrome c-type biogenesis protein
MATAMLFDVTSTTAFVAGLLSFFSPCVLPLIPSYFCFITGLSLEKLTTAHHSAIRSKIILATLAFVTGFSVIFIVLGASATLLGELLRGHQAWIRIAGGILIILFGLHLTGLLPIPLLQHEKRLHLHRKPLHFLGTFLIGMAFGAGWTPCIGPILGSVLVLAQSKETVSQGAWLLALYSAGLALPFILLSAGINYLVVIVRKTSKILRFINPAAGILLIATGLLLVTNKLALLSF